MSSPFKSLTPKQPKLWVAVIYSEEFPVAGMRAWAIAFIDADDEEQAAARLFDAGRETLIGKDAELFEVPSALAQRLAGAPRNVPLGDPNPLVGKIQAVIGEWLDGVLTERRKVDRGRPEREVALAYNDDVAAIMVGEIIQKKETLH